MAKKAGLAMTLDDEIAIGSTPPKVLVDNPGKTFAETMNDGELLSFMTEQVVAVSQSHALAMTGDEREMRIFDLQLHGFLAPNVAYLREIGRLPKELGTLDPLITFALPVRPSADMTGVRENLPPSVVVGIVDALRCLYSYDDRRSMMHDRLDGICEVVAQLAAKGFVKDLDPILVEIKAMIVKCGWVWNHESSRFEARIEDAGGNRFLDELKR